MRLFVYRNFIVNTDNDPDAETLKSDPETVRELSQEEIQRIFGDLAHHAGPDNTQISDDGDIVFDRTKAELVANEILTFEKKAQAKADMENTLAKGVEVNGRTYACQKTDIDSFTDGLNLLALTGETEIEAYDKDDTAHTLSLDKYKTVCREVGLVYHGALRTYKAKLKEIEG